MLNVVMVFLMACSALLAQPPSKSAQLRNDWLIVPGIRVGPISESTSRRDLVRTFGASFVTDESIHVGEEEYVRATVVYANDPSRRLEIFWEDETLPRSVRVCGLWAKTCRWRTAGGISLGTTLRRIEVINGRIFKMFGFGWDYSGTVYSWDSGKLDTHGRGRFIVRLDSLQPESVSPEQYSLVVGDRDDLLSSHPVLQKLNPTVYQILFEFPNKRVR